MSFEHSSALEEKCDADSANASALSTASRSSRSPSVGDARSCSANDDAYVGAVNGKVVTWDGIAAGTSAEDVVVASVVSSDGAACRQPATPASPLQAFVNGLVGNIVEGLRGFDGSVSWLKRTSAAAAAQLEAIKAPAAALPDNVEEFSVAWFGVASVVLHDLIHESVAEMTLCDPPASPTAASDEAASAAAGVRAGAREVALTFVSALQSIVMEVVNDGGCHAAAAATAAGGRQFARYALRSFTYAKEVSELSSRLMGDRMTKGTFMPDALRSKYADDATVVDCREDYCAILSHVADAWVCSFFPAYQQMSRSTGETLPYLWAEDGEEDTSRLDVDLFFYYFYFACEQRSLMKNADGLPRGVLVPTAWLEQLLAWTAEAKRLRALTPPGALPPFPGPMDTFDLVSVSPHDPRRHRLELATGRYQVIPESLFDSFFRFFGAGPKYTLYGAFPLRERCLAAWKALPLRLEVSFAWLSVNKADGIPDDFNVTVFVDDALLHSEMREVCHLAWGLAVEEKEIMSEEAARVWGAAINGTDTVRIRCKGLFMLSVGREALPIAADSDGMEMTVQEVLQLLRTYLATNRPDCMADFTEQTATEIFLCLSVTLHNVNGDGRDREITGTMEVNAHNSGVCGLTNVGNTCYMNSALQCLSNLSGFRRQLLTLPVSHFPQATITPAFVRLLSSMWCGQHSFANTRDLKDQIGSRVKRFAGYQQQDASEFIEVLLDHMSEEINRVSARSYRQREDADKDMPTPALSTIFWNNFLENNQTFISPLFFHQSKTVFTCLTCGESSTVFDNNVTLPVSIKDPPQKRTYSAEVLVEMTRTDGQATASPSRAVGGGGAGVSVVQATLRVQAPVQADNTVRSEDVEQSIARALLSVACDSKEVYAFFFDSADGVSAAGGEPEERPMAWWEEKKSVLQSRLRVEARVMEVPDHGRVYAWAQLSLAAPQQKAEPPQDKAVPALRVWYFLKNVHDIASTTFTTTPVWVDEVPAAYHPATAHGETEGLQRAPLSRQIIARSKQIAASMLRCTEEEDEEEGEREGAGAADREGTYAAADALSGSGGYFTPPTGPSDDETPRREAAAAPSAADPPAPAEKAAAAPRELSVKVMRRVSRMAPLENVATMMHADGDAWLNLDEARSSSGGDDAAGDAAQLPAPRSSTASACPTTATVVIFIQYDATAYSAAVAEVVESLCVRPHTSFQSEAKCTLHECLRHSMEPDVLRGEDAWFCSQCKEFRETRVHRTLYRLPPCLIVSFKRFKMHTYSADKKDTTVQFPTEMDFAAYLDPEAVAVQEEGTQYRLRGVVYHSGSLSFGHYTATAFNDSVKKWVYYNDTRATIDGNDSPTPNGAYILCYERIAETSAAE